MEVNIFNYGTFFEVVKLRKWMHGGVVVCNNRTWLSLLRRNAHNGPVRSFWACDSIYSLITSRRHVTNRRYARPCYIKKTDFWFVVPHMLGVWGPDVVDPCGRFPVTTLHPLLPRTRFILNITSSPKLWPN